MPSPPKTQELASLQWELHLISAGRACPSDGGGASLASDGVAWPGSTPLAEGGGGGPRDTGGISGLNEALYPLQSTFMTSLSVSCPPLSISSRANALFRGRIVRVPGLLSRTSSSPPSYTLSSLNAGRLVRRTLRSLGGQCLP